MSIKISKNKKHQNKTNLARRKVRFISRTGEVMKTTNEFQPGVSIITTTNRINYIDKIFNNYLRQEYENKELILVLHNNSFDVNKYKEKANQYSNIKVFQCDETVNFGECKNFGFDQAKFDYIAIFDDDDYYAPNYLNQSMSSFDYAKCDIVGKRSCFMYFEERKILGIFCPGNENIFVNGAYVMDSSMIIKREILERIRFPITSHPAQVLSVFQRLCFDNNIKIYSTHRFNYVVHRRNSQTHTWDIADEGILKWCDIIGNDITDYTKYITS